MTFQLHSFSPLSGNSCLCGHIFCHWVRSKTVGTSSNIVKHCRRTNMNLCVKDKKKRGKNCWSQISNENRRWVLHGMDWREGDTEKEKREWKYVWEHKTGCNSFSTGNDCWNVCSLHIKFKMESQIDGTRGEIG